MHEMTDNQAKGQIAERMPAVLNLEPGRVRLEALLSLLQGSVIFATSQAKAEEAL